MICVIVPCMASVATCGDGGVTAAVETVAAAGPSAQMIAVPAVVPSDDMEVKPALTSKRAGDLFSVISLIDGVVWTFHMITFEPPLVTTRPTPSAPKKNDWAPDLEHRRS
jgi:hypothetical protein